MVAVTAVGWGVLAWVASRPVIGAAAAVAVVVGATLKRGRLLVRLVAVGALLSLVAYSVWQQGTHGYWPDIGWPGDLTASNDIAWLALSCLGADLVAGALRRSAYPGRLEETSI
jgi:hypothetical protein